MLHSELGDQLRRAREAKNLSLDEAEKATGIRKRFLQAMEEGRFDALPGEIQLRGFLRNYAGYVGLNGDDLIAIYERRTRPVPAGPAPSTGKAASPVQPSPARLAGPQPVKPHIPPAVQPQPSRAAQSASGAQTVAPPQSAPAGQPAWLSRLPAWLTVERILIAIAILMLICIAVLVVLLLTSPSNGAAAPASRPVATQTRPVAPTLPPATPETSATAARPEAALASSAKLTATAKLTTTAEFVQVALAASEHVWVRVVTDGKTAFEGMFAPSQSLKWEAKEILAVETGNGAGLNVSFNGKPLGAFGPRGQLAARAWTPAGETAVPPKPTAALATPNP